MTLFANECPECGGIKGKCKCGPPPSLVDLRDNYNVMVDLETFGNRSNAAITAIGAVIFTDKILRSDYMLVDPQSCIDIGMEFDTSTILWWLGQSEEARLEMTKKCARYSIRDALLHLSAVVDDVKNKTFGVSSTKTVYFWGNGATFDNVILGNAYHLCKIPPFWKYSKDMCYRTLRAMFHNFPYLKDDGVKHKAISDAIYQTNCFLKLMEIMHGVKKDGSE